MSAPSDEELPKGLTGDSDKLLPTDTLLLPKERVGALMDHWHNARLMHPGRDKMQRDFEWGFHPGWYTILNCYCNHCAVCRATKSPNHSSAGNPVYTLIPEAPMCSIANYLIAMPEVTVEREKYDCIISAVDPHHRKAIKTPSPPSTLINSYAAGPPHLSTPPGKK